MEGKDRAEILGCESDGTGDARHSRGFHGTAVGSMAQPALAVPKSRAGQYLGFVDGAVESVVLLVVEQAEIQCPQRGCKGGETR